MDNVFGDLLNSIVELFLETITAFLVDLVTGLFSSGNGGGLLG